MSHVSVTNVQPSPNKKTPNGMIPLLPVIAEVSPNAVVEEIVEIASTDSTPQILYPTTENLNQVSGPLLDTSHYYLNHLKTHNVYI